MPGMAGDLVLRLHHRHGEVHMELDGQLAALGVGVAFIPHHVPGGKGVQSEGENVEPAAIATARFRIAGQHFLQGVGHRVLHVILQERRLAHRVKEFSPRVRTPVVRNGVIMPKHPSEQPGKTFRSKPTKACFRLMAVMLLLAAFFAGFGLANMRLLQQLALVPIGISMLLILLVGLLLLSCVGRAVVTDERGMTYRSGSRDILVHWRELRDVIVNKRRLYRQLIASDGMNRFAVLDLAFPQFEEIVDIARTAKATRRERYSEYHV